MRVNQVPKARRRTVAGRRGDRIRDAVAENVFCLGRLTRNVDKCFMNVSGRYGGRHYRKTRIWFPLVGC